MILDVPWSDFAEEVKAKIGPSAKVYLAYRDGRTLATASEPRLSFIVRSQTNEPNRQILQYLAKHDLNASTGEWLTGSEDRSQDLAIAAVSYLSNEESPGLWVEAFPYIPDVSDVISRLINEFRREGALEGITTEQFHTLARPNVVILTKDEIKNLIEHHQRESNDQRLPSAPAVSEKEESAIDP